MEGRYHPDEADLLLHPAGAEDHQRLEDVVDHCRHLDVVDRYHRGAEGHCLLDVVDRPDAGGHLDVMNCLDLGERS